MSDMRISKIFQILPSQVKSLTGLTFDSTFALKANTQISTVNTAGLAGLTACVIDATATTWATGNLRAIVVANPASDYYNTLAMRTQSHAQGQYLTGSSSFSIYMEAPASFGSALDFFERQLIFCLQGQQGAPCTLYFTAANGTEPTIAGLNGASATATYSAPVSLAVYGGGVGYPGGV